MDRTDINHENRINRDMKTSMEIDSCWSLHMADGTEDTETIPAVVPGDLYSDLLRAGMIDDPYFRDNELEALRLSDRDYKYETSFDADAELLSRDRIRLVFEGLDTLAEIRLNGVLVGTADNMHRTWKFDIKDILKAEDNYLSILFRSPTRYIRSRGGVQNKIPEWQSMPNVTSAHRAKSPSRTGPALSALFLTKHAALTERMTMAIIKMSLDRKNIA